MFYSTEGEPVSNESIVLIDPCFIFGIFAEELYTIMVAQVNKVVFFCKKRIIWSNFCTLFIITFYPFEDI
jgi:hypothetical protein